MDWRSIKFDWNRARAFLVTAEEGSLSAAARALGMAQPTMGRHISALEEELGVLLFERVGHTLVLTETGRDLVEHVRAMGEAASRVSLAASGQSQAVEGTVRITSTEAYSAFVLPPLLARLRAAHPGIVLEVVADNSVADLRRREADIALRSARPTDPELIARKIAQEQACLYASEDCLSRDGPFTRSEDLAGAAFIGFDQNAPFLDGLTRKGLPVTQGNFTVLTDNHLVQWQLVRQGVGIGVMATRIGDAEPGLRRVADWLDPFEFPIWLVAHRELSTSRRVRLVFDFIAREFGAL